MTGFLVRKNASLVVGASVVLALTLTGCGDDVKASKAPEKSAQDSHAKDKDKAKDPSPSHSPSKSASPSAPPKPKPTRAAKPPGTSGTSGGNSGGGRASKPGTTPGGSSSTGGSGAGAASAQGNWYYPYRLNGKTLALSVSGTSFTIRVSPSGKSCSGTISSSLRIATTCKGEPSNGQAVITEGGQKISLNWDNDKPDQFGRAKPQ